MRYLHCPPLLSISLTTFGLLSIFDDNFLFFSHHFYPLKKLQFELFCPFGLFIIIPISKKIYPFAYKEIPISKLQVFFLNCKKQTPSCRFRNFNFEKEKKKP